MTRYIVTGSYNGQDSLGDECLLKCVMARIAACDSEAEFDIHLHDRDTPFVEQLAARADCHIMPGLQTIFWSWRARFERISIPRPLSTALAALSFPLLLILAAIFDVASVRRTLASLFSAKAIFIYGGTQFSGKWYWVNAPYYMLSCLLVRLSGGRAFLCQQQYGPQTAAQAWLMRVFIRVLVSDWRTRSAVDLDLLAPIATASHEIYDEVFSNQQLYPTMPAQTPAEHILVNLRATTFDNEDDLEGGQFGAFPALVDALQVQFNLPIVFFAVSDASFCDDDAAFEFLKAAAQNPSAYSSIGRVRDEFHLFELANRARFTLSMSFHGCILSGIGGAPFVPVTEGQYYDYKYADFPKYAGDQDTPLIALSDCDVGRDSARIAQYVQSYNPETSQAARDAGDALGKTFYDGAVNRG